MKRVDLLRAGLAISLVGAMLLCQPAYCQARGASASDPSKSAVPQPMRSDPGETNNYVIGDNDILAISVWNEPNMRQSIPVRPDGKISLPLIGDIQAAGRTPTQLQADIATKLEAYITHPDVTVIVQAINSKKYNVLGRVLKPGSYPLSRTTTVLDAIAQAGGFQDFAKEKGIYILRDKPGAGKSRFPFNYKDVIKGKHLEENIDLEPNDTIVVP
jgi:polysaccharide export outer membrane protein